MVNFPRKLGQFIAHINFVHSPCQCIMLERFKALFNMSHRSLLSFLMFHRGNLIAFCQELVHYQKGTVSIHLLVVRKSFLLLGELNLDVIQPRNDDLTANIQFFRVQSSYLQKEANYKKKLIVTYRKKLKNRHL